MTRICLKGLQSVNKNIAREMLDLKGVSESNPTWNERCEAPCAWAGSVFIVGRKS